MPVTTADLRAIADLIEERKRAEIQTQIANVGGEIDQAGGATFEHEDYGGQQVQSQEVPKKIQEFNHNQTYNVGHQVIKTQEASKKIQEFNPNQTYNVGDIVTYNNKKWSCRVDGTIGIKPPWDNETYNDAWKLLPNGGRRKTKRRGKKYSRRR